MSTRVEHAIFEYASPLTAKALCTGPKPCNGSPITQSELCFGKVINFSVGQCVKWRHWGCMTTKALRDLREQFPDPSIVDGFNTLRHEDKSRIMKAWKLGRIQSQDVSEKLKGLSQLRVKYRNDNDFKDEPTSASQKVLDSPVLLYEIFEFVENSRGTCFSLALTCKAFQQPALATLWRRLDSIFPILRVISNFESTEDGRTWFIDGPIRTPDVEKLKIYGSRVRSFFSFEDNMGRKTIDPSVFPLVSSVLDGASLFPNLHTLGFCLLSNDANRGALSLLFSSTRLRNLSLVESGMGDVELQRTLCFSTFLQQLAYAGASELTSLKLVCVPTDSMINALTALGSLTSLEFDLRGAESIVTWAVFDTFAHYGILKSLTIKSDYRFIEDGLDSPLLLQNLESLSIDCPFDDAIEFLSCFSTPSLSSFSLGFVLPDTPQATTFQWTQLLKQLKNSSERISEISICPRQPSQSDSNLVRVFNRVYRGIPFDELAAGIFQFDLKKLSLPFSLLHSFDLDILGSIIDKFPQLRCLEIFTTTKRSLGINDLEVIANRMPQLRQLTIDVDCRAIHPPSPPSHHHRLRRIMTRANNWEATPESQNDFAMTIDTLFPYVCTLYVDPDPETRHMEDILNLVKQLQRARRSERVRYGIKDELADIVIESNSRYEFSEDIDVD